MHNIQVKEAKALFIKTGRLNKKIVNEEISKSWYRCFITHLNAGDSIKNQNQSNLTKSELNEEIIDYVSKVIDHNYDYLICDKNADVVFKNIANTTFSTINNVDEVLIGTNAAAISLRTQKYFKIALEEHYLNIFTGIYTIALPIVVHEKFMGVCMILSDLNLTEYDFIKVQDILKNIKMDSNDILNESKVINNSYVLEKLFSYPEPYFETFRKHIKQLIEYRLPTLIMGEEGSGKTALAIYLAGQISKSRIIIDAKEIPKCIRYDEVLNGLYQYDTVIVENFELLDGKSIALLTVYTEEKIIGKHSKKYSDYKCYNLILTTVYTKADILFELNINQRLLTRINQSSIVLRNLADFTNDYSKLVKSIVTNNGLNCTAEFIDKLSNTNRNKSFKEVALNAQLSELNNKNVSVYSTQHLAHIEEEKLLSLEEMEAQYIEKVLRRVDNNLTLAAEIIGIGRSTLYRKLEKYHIDTKGSKS